mmetsp:Transcript_33922/g.54423  ORF Transcript_33922/g.54423 Transcript_33922/m.54423 type:complete len:155 (-) Transcript_33922:133-597(-)
MVRESRSHKYPEGRWERVVMKDYYQAHHKVAYALLTWGLSTAERHTAAMHRGQSPPVKETADAVWAFERCVELIEWCVERHPEPVPSFYFRNLGICHQRLWGMQPTKQEHHEAMIRAFRGYIDVGKDDPKVQQEGGFDAVVDIVRKADAGQQVA